MNSFFVTASGTDVGKTLVMTTLCWQLHQAGKKVTALKPVVSGFDPQAPAKSDPALLLGALGRDVDDAEIEAISPWRFTAALSPDMAARQEGRSIDFARLVEFCRVAIAGAEDVLLIEGIGGLMVPLDARATVLDLVAELAIPILLVAGTYLGTLSHVLTALAAARHRAVEIRALVLNQSPDSSVPIEETITTLTNFCAPLPILSLQRGGCARLEPAKWDPVLR